MIPILPAQPLPPAGTQTVSFGQGTKLAPGHIAADFASLLAAFSDQPGRAGGQVRATPEVDIVAEAEVELTAITPAQPANVADDVRLDIVAPEAVGDETPKPPAPPVIPDTAPMALVDDPILRPDVVSQRAILSTGIESAATPPPAPKIEIARQQATVPPLPETQKVPPMKSTIMTAEAAAPSKSSDAPTARVQTTFPVDPAPISAKALPSTQPDVATPPPQPVRDAGKAIAVQASPTQATPGLQSNQRPTPAMATGTAPASQASDIVPPAPLPVVRTTTASAVAPLQVSAPKTSATVLTAAAVVPAKTAIAALIDRTLIAAQAPAGLETTAALEQRPQPTAPPARLSETRDTAAPALPTTTQGTQVQLRQPIHTLQPQPATTEPAPTQGSAQITPVVVAAAAAPRPDTEAERKTHPKFDQVVDISPASSAETRRTPPSGITFAQPTATVMPISTPRAGPDTLAPVDRIDPLVRFDPAAVPERVTATQGTAVAPAGADQARHVVQQLAAALPSTTPGTTEITLQPEELGRVRMTLSVVDGALTLMIHADRPETTDLLRRHIDQLAQTYRQMGFDTLNFGFAGSAQRDTQGAQPQRFTGEDTDMISSEVIDPKPAVRSDGRLDLRM